MPITQTSTSLGSVTSAANGATTAVPAAMKRGGTHPVLLVVSTGVTTGATLRLEGRNKKGVGDVATDWRPLVPDEGAVITATGSKVFPLAAYQTVGLLPDEVRIVGAAYTDGTHACSLVTYV